jgi:hypothetical protein
MTVRDALRHIDMRPHAEVLSARRTATPPFAIAAPERLSPSARERALVRKTEHPPCYRRVFGLMAAKFSFA